MKYIKKRYNRMSIKNKIIFLYLPLALIPLLLFAIVSYNIHQNTIIKRALINSKENNWLIIGQVEDILEDAENCADMLAININNIIDKYTRDMPSQPHISLLNAINNELSYSMIIFEDISSIAYIDVNQLVYNTHPNLVENSDKVNEDNYIDKLSNSRGNSIWFDMTTRDYLVVNEEQAVLTLGKKIIDIETGATMGYLFINIKEDTISSVFKKQSSRLFIFDNEKVISANNDNNTLGSNSNYVNNSIIKYKTSYSGVHNIDEERTVVTSVPFNKMEWQLISETPLLDLTRDIKEFSQFIIILTIAIILVQIGNSRLLSHVITNPLKLLTTSAKKIGKGDFNLYFNIEREDEIGVLASGFNKMALKIKELIENVKYEQKKKREYELALIQEQIKPHFLYNCLDVIYTLSQMGRNDEASEATKALADYYRVSLSKGKDIIPIRDEIENVKDYLSLQEIRYRDIFSYEINIDESIKEHKIPKLTLQPIVENAIYHGLKPSNREGIINISGFKKDGNIIIAVVDNGVGMDSNKIHELLVNKSDYKSFGLYNVQDRLKLFFGGEYGIEIDSEVNEGTEVRVILPEECEHD